MLFEYINIQMPASIFVATEADLQPIVFAEIEAAVKMGQQRRHIYGIISVAYILRKTHLKFRLGSLNSGSKNIITNNSIN